MNGDLLWPRYADPGDLASIETVPLAPPSADRRARRTGQQGAAPS